MRRPAPTALSSRWTISGRRQFPSMPPTPISSSIISEFRDAARPAGSLSGSARNLRHQCRRGFDLLNYKNPVGEQFANSERDDLASKNISSLILEVPINCLTAGDPVIGAWHTASTAKGDRDESGKAGNNDDRDRPDGFKSDGFKFDGFVQKSRLGNPLVNELVIGLKDKDRFNASEPRNDAQFLTYVTNPTFPAIIELIFGTPAPTLFPRTDLIATFLTGIAGVNQPAHVRPAEMMRLNTSTPVTPAASQNRLGVIGGDAAGYPNGRRPGDDVVDITLRVAMGKLIALGLFGNPAQAPSGNLEFTDGALVDASFFDASFPYLKTAAPRLARTIPTQRAVAAEPDPAGLRAGRGPLSLARPCRRRHPQMSRHARVFAGRRWRPD